MLPREAALPLKQTVKNDAPVLKINLFRKYVSLRIIWQEDQVFIVVKSDSDSACQDLFTDNNQLAIHYLVTNDCAPTMASYHSLCCSLFVYWN